MAHINVPEGVPGIRSLVMFRPETGKPLYELAQVLLRGESPLTEAERELIWMSMKVDKETKMGILTDVKLQLREANALKLNYSSNKRVEQAGM